MVIALVLLGTPLVLCIAYIVRPGILWRLEAVVPQSMKSISETIAVLLDRTPPTTPSNLRGGRAPTIQRAVGYYNATHQTQHTMPPFDSRGGDVMIAFATTHGNLFLTPSDDFGNTWTSLTGPTAVSGNVDLRSQIWYVKNPKTGPNHVFTIGLSRPHALVISMFVVRGSNVFDPIDVFSMIGDDADRRTSMPISPAITTTRPYGLLLGFGKSFELEVWEAGIGFVLQHTASSGYHAAESGLAVNPGSYSATFTLRDPSNWQSAIVAVRPASPSNTSQITLAWEPSTDNVRTITYQVERCVGIGCDNFIQIGSSKQALFVDSFTPTSAEYRYRVRAMDAARNASKYSNTITIPQRSP